MRHLKQSIQRYQMALKKEITKDNRSFLTENSDEILSLFVVIITTLVLGYQALMKHELTMSTEMAMLILGFVFGKKAC